MRRSVLTILASLIALSSFAITQCTITGEVLNRDSKALLLRKCSESRKSFYETPVRIPIKKGKFTYTFPYAEMEAYEIVFEDELEAGSWKAIVFFPSEVVRFQLYPLDEADSNKITGGASNAEYADYLLSKKELFRQRRLEITEIQNDLIAADEYDSPEYRKVLQELRATKSSDHDARVPIHRKLDEMRKTHARYTREAKQLVIGPLDSLMNAEMRWQYGYMKDNISPVTYYLMWNDVEMRMKDNPLVAKLVTDAFPLFQNKYPEHIYTKRIGMQVAGMHMISPGNKYIDIKAPSVNGDTVLLSDVIQNRVALIDFWGSWCGPCIAKSRLVVPLYHQYKEQGFEVVGIAREFGSTDAVKRRLGKEQFSWLNLIELDDKQNIWNLYGISNGAGLMVLVDRDGLILAVDPTPEELENMLQKILD